MFLKRTRSGRSSVGSNSLIHEPETNRLQRDIERLTQKLEYEKRESNYLDERIEMITHEIGLIKQKEKNSKGNSSAFSQLKSSLAMLERKLEFEVIQLNEAKANNRKIRDSIDEFRLERLSYKRTLQSLETDLTSYSQQAESKNLEYRQAEELDQKQKSKICILRCKSANDETRYGKKINQLTSVLHEEKQKRSKIFKVMEQEVLSNLDRPIEGIEVSRMLKKILEKWSHNTKEKKRSLDSYTKHIKVVEDAFKQIQQATGISSIEEIVTAFIKSQEQNYEIYTYMNNLTSEIDTLEEYLRQTKGRISMMEEFKTSGGKKSIEIREKLEKEYEKIEKKINSKKGKLENLRAEMQGIMPMITKIIQIVDSMPVKLEMTQKLDKSWLENFSEENIMSLLGYVEEFINSVLILLAFISSSENPMTKHIPLDTLTSKNFDQRPFDLKEVLEAKDLLEDKELDEIKNPLPVSELKNKAIIMYEKKRALSENLNEARPFSSINPKLN
ncbi:hypothetical protein SteCoe_22593 [Stentor coeruleus]|uniref:ODAD1 central coiled coil region domain-containing protein n=1 Tax=Stentor coeruleus TaxID=5963 RepID=A0A1R2BLY0_9CILI|nr:hypothetical protein SteCoe_22593 [Stentor coeruleus]